MVQVYILYCHTGFGEQTCTITDRGAHFEPQMFMFAIIEALLPSKGAKMKGASLHSEGCTDIRVLTSTLKGANLS